MTTEQTSAVGVTVGTRVSVDTSVAIHGETINNRDGSWGLPKYTAGTVAYINLAHRWLLVEWGNRVRAGFKLDDLGIFVKVCG